MCDQRCCFVAINGRLFAFHRIGYFENCGAVTGVPHYLQRSRRRTHACGRAIFVPSEVQLRGTSLSRKLSGRLAKVCSFTRIHRVPNSHTVCGSDVRRQNGQLVSHNLATQFSATHTSHAKVTILFSSGNIRSQRCPGVDAARPSFPSRFLTFLVR